MATALLIVATPGALTSGEQFLKTRLESTHGLTVVEYDDNAAEYGSPVDLIVMAESISSTAVGTKYRTNTAGIIIFENGSWDDLSLTSSGGQSNITTNSWVLADGTTHPIADGVITPFGMFTGSTNVRTLDPSTAGPGIENIVHQGTRPDRSLVFAYDTGSIGMSSFEMPGRRVGFGMFDANMGVFSDEGLQILDNAILWAGNITAVPQQTGQGDTLFAYTDLWEATGVQQQIGNGDLNFYPVFGHGTGMMVGASPAYSWSVWNGATEEALTLEGVWNGATVDAAEPEVVE